MKKIIVIIGTRPNFIKVTQFKKVAKQYPDIEIKIAHTGQHYDYKMSQVFFEQFGLQPDYFLEIGAGSPNTQMAEIMLRLEKLITEEFKPDLMIVPGDVNSTLAAALTANKTDIKLAHLESGLRSFDRAMPEEINRILTDEISDYYFITEKSGTKHLTAEKKQGKQYFVGNTMIDTMVAFEDSIDKAKISSKYNLKENDFVLVTIHRPSNVDTKEKLILILELLEHLNKIRTAVFPVHPRTLQRFKDFGLEERLSDLKNIIQTAPLSYFDFQQLIKNCKFVLTDSGGIQEETTFRQKPCLTLRNNTERPITVDLGTNIMITFAQAKSEIGKIEAGTFKKGEIPPLWDGKATERIMEIISKL
ncbi:MAG: UDP-N-acetylglucosamine 2-epimerase (non-hydrolyzing) [Bacteroidota bacterium]|nr:UDP-N-acetylglucosamine 2-epimerase (non-hydrolyzing) [Bacteroidota bacterium]